MDHSTDGGRHPEARVKEGPSLRDRASKARIGATRLVRRLGAGGRALPDFLIIGAQKAGTTSLFHYLSNSPDIRAPLVKEVHYFDLEFSRGPTWYRTNFPRRTDVDNWSSCDSSPFYLLHPLAPQRARQTVPDAKIICILRDPVTRAHSHWRHEVRLGTEALSFPAALAAEEARTGDDWRRLAADPGFASAAVQQYTYFKRGVYQPQLMRWSSQFPTEQTLILESSEFARSPEATTGLVCDFLGVRHPGREVEYRPYNVGTSSTLDPATEAALADRYREVNLELFEYLGKSYRWRGVEPA